jgi:hypothetical protein
MGYDVHHIGIQEKDSLCTEYGGRPFYSSKADIYGICVKLYTEDKDMKDMWDDNFYAMSSTTRSHARIVCVDDPDRGTEVLYERSTNTAFLFNFDYYGWVKSLALAVASDILEDSHQVFSVHGAALDVDGAGVTLIAPSKTGKTTQSWGLLRAGNTRLVTDDWYFVRIGGGRPVIMGSEKNCYIDADIGDVWEEYRPLVRTVKFDNKGRGIANIRWVTGNGSVIPMTTMKHVILMKRDKEDKEVIRRMDAEEAVEYMMEHDLCNPHQMVRDERKMDMRKQFFRDFFGNSNVYMVNTILAPKETQARIREIILR